MSDTKYCWYCGFERPFTNFNKNGSKPDGYSDIERECRNAYNRERRKKNRHAIMEKKRANQAISAAERKKRHELAKDQNIRNVLKDMALENAYTLALALPDVVKHVMPALDEIITSKKSKNSEKIKAIHEVINIVQTLMPPDEQAKIIQHNTLNIPGVIYVPVEKKIEDVTVIEFDENGNPITPNH